MFTLPFTRAEYETRWSAVQAQMRRRGLDAVVVFGRGGGTYERFQDVFYLTNFYSTQSGCMKDGMLPGYRAVAHAAVLLKIGEEPILVADDPLIELEMVSTTRNVGGFDVVGTLAATLHKEHIGGKVGMVGADTISAKHFAALQVLAPGIEWEEHDELVADVRIVKSPAELAIFRYGGETVSNALTAMFKALQMGASESDAAGEAAREVYRRQGHINLILLSHGPGTAQRLTDNPISCYSAATPADGDIVRGWVYGAMCQGYWLDPGRTTVRPSPDGRTKAPCGKLCQPRRGVPEGHTARCAGTRCGGTRDPYPK